MAVKKKGYSARRSLEHKGDEIIKDFYKRRKPINFPVILTDSESCALRHVS